MDVMIAIALTLIAITGGMFLLAKAKTENLGWFYKIGAWKIIIIAALCLICCLVRGFMGDCEDDCMDDRDCGMKEHCEKMPACCDSMMKNGSMAADSTKMMDKNQEIGEHK